MNNVIQQLDTNTFYMESRGNKMTLKKKSTIFGDIWEMYTDNASRRAWRGLGVKEFDTLADVQKHYKSWRGISLLVAE